jgi:hypothetical protein
VYGITAEDFDRDGNVDILMAGNFYQAKPEVGIYDASFGVLLKGDGKGNFTAIPTQQSGISVRGAVRDIVVLKRNKNKTLLFAQNNEPLKIFNKNF